MDGADDEARALGLTPRSSVPNMADETIFHGLHRQWRTLMSKGGAHE